MIYDSSNYILFCKHVAAFSYAMPHDVANNYVSLQNLVAYLYHGLKKKWNV